MCELLLKSSEFKIVKLSKVLAQLFLFAGSLFFQLFSKMAEISNKDWALHIKMDYAQNLRKDPVKGKNGLVSLNDKKYKINEMSQSIIKLMICINEKSNL